MSRWMLPLIVILLTMLSLSAQEPVPTAIRPTSSPRVPIVGSSRCLGCDNSPSDAEVLRYLKPLPSVPNVCETTRDNIVIVKNRLVDKLDEPRFFPLVGPAQLHRCRWECVATYTETTQTFHPFPMKLNARKSEILYIDKDYLEVTRGNESVTVPLKCELAVSKESPCSEAAPAKVATRPAYIIEPPDNISITALLKNGRGTLDLPGQAISGLFLVRADGCVNLGVWGSVSVSGMTLDQAADAVRQVVLKGLNEPKMEPVKADQILVLVDVVASNSKRYYVITESDEGQQVATHPWTGNSTVLDAIGAINGLPKNASKCKVWIARPKSEKCAAKQLSIDWVGITQRGETATNYILLPGDRLCVSNKDPIMEAARPASAVLPALLPTPFAARPVVDVRKLPLAGTWFRQMPGAVAAFTFRDDEFSLVFTVNDEGDIFNVTLTGDCAVTKDGTVHGVVTGVDVSSPNSKDQDFIGEMMELSKKMQGMVDQPFAIRFRPSGVGMMASNARFADGGPLMKELDAGICGMYQSAAYRPVPKPEAVKERKAFQHRCEPPMPMVLVPGPNGYGPHPFQHVPQLGPAYPVPQDFAFPVGGGPPGYSPPEPPVYPPSLLPPACPVPSNPPPEIQRMMFKAIGMSQIPQAMPEAPAVGAPPARPSDAVWVSRPMAMPESPSLACLPPCNAPERVHALGSGNLPLGTWVRKADGLQVKLEVKQDHVALTGSGKDGQCWLAIDCYPTRTAGEVVGIIRSCELKPAEGAISPDFLQEVSAVAAELCNKPIAFKFRLCDGALTLDGVNAPKEITNLAGKYEKSNPSTATPNLKGAVLGATVEGLVGTGIGAAIGMDADRRKAAPTLPRKR